MKTNISANNLTGTSLPGNEHAAASITLNEARSRLANVLGRRLKLALGGMTALLLLNCSADDSASTSAAPPAAGGSSSAAGRAADDDAGSPSETSGGSASGEARCSPSKGTTGAPKTIYEVVELVNGLPHPVDFPCFLESLERPLSINANFNTQSAQPAVGKRSPRTFIITDELFSMSFVPGAEPTLEFGERPASDPTVSVKGELHFPIEDQLAPEDAFSRISPDEATGLTLEQATKCGVCHDKEQASSDYPFLGAFSSAIVRPQPFFLVDVAFIKQERDDCDSASEPERCAVLEALFDHGEVQHMDFP